MVSFLFLCTFCTLVPVTLPFSSTAPNHPLLSYREQEYCSVLSYISPSPKTRVCIEPRPLQLHTNSSLFDMLWIWQSWRSHREVEVWKLPAVTDWRGYSHLSIFQRGRASQGLMHTWKNGEILVVLNSLVSLQHCCSAACVSGACVPHTTQIPPL